MQTFLFQLSEFSPFRNVAFRELTGHDESTVHDCTTPTAIRLLQHLIVQPQGDGETKISAEKITVADRDYLLAKIYEHTYGPGIESISTCDECNERYEINFLLDDLINHNKYPIEEGKVDANGFYVDSDGLCFRPPNGADELAIWGLNPEEVEEIFLRRCLLDTGKKKNEEIIELMERFAPVLTTDLNVNCPECGRQQTVQFDMQSYLLTKLMNDSRTRTREIHSIALSYHWSHQEILDLPRRLRKVYSRLINQI